MQKYAALGGCILLAVGCSSATNTTGSDRIGIGVGFATQSADGSIDSERSPFVGKWCGYWSNGSPGEMRVSEVTGTGEARGVYLWSSWKNIGWKPKELEGRIVNEELQFTDDFRNANVSYRLRQDGSLVGTWARDDGTWIVEMKRCDEKRLENKDAGAARYRTLVGNWCGRWRQRPSGWSRKTIITVKDVTDAGFVTLIYTGRNRGTTTSNLHKGIVVGRNLRFSLGKRPAEFSFEYITLSGTMVGTTGTNDIEIHHCIDSESAMYTTDHGQEFLGHWCGYWNNSEFGRLIVSRVDNSGLAGIRYMYRGANWDWTQSTVAQGTITNGKLNFTLQGPKLQYWIEDSGYLAGTYDKPGTHATIRAKQCPPDGEFGALNR